MFVGKGRQVSSGPLTHLFHHTTPANKIDFVRNSEFSALLEIYSHGATAGGGRNTQEGYESVQGGGELFKETLYSIRLVLIFKYFFDFSCYPLYNRCQGCFWRICLRKGRKKLFTFQRRETKMIDSQQGAV